MAVIRSIIRGVGAHLPKRVVTNNDLSKIVDTTDEWIVERSGIRSRHIADDDEQTLPGLHGPAIRRLRSVSGPKASLAMPHGGHAGLPAWPGMTGRSLLR